MGSVGLFDTSWCWMCGDAVPPSYPSEMVPVCIPCAQRAREHRYKLIYGPLCAPRGGIWVARHVQDFVEVHSPSDIRKHKKYYLRCVLMSEDSRFRDFAFSSNGLTGSISDVEDIIDRIMRFV